MKARILCLATGKLAAMAGCDRPANPPANSQPGAAQNPPATKPATAARKVLQAHPYPLKISVPAEWSIVEMGDVMFLQGPTPGGQDVEDVARILISKPPTLAHASAERLEKEFLASKDTTDASVLKTDVRSCGKGRLLEKRAIQKLSDGSGTLVNWTLDLMVAGDGERTSLYHLSFVALFQARYEKDREFLEGIVSSLQYDASLEISPK